MKILKYWRRDYYKQRYWKNWQSLVAPSVNFDFKTIDPHALTTRNLSLEIPARGNMESFGGACSLEKIFNNTVSTTTDSNYCGFKVKSGAASPYSTAVAVSLPFSDVANNNLLHITKVTLATRPNDNFASTLKMGVRRWTSATEFVWEQPITGNLYQTVTTAAGATNYIVFQGDVYTDWIYFDFANCSPWFGVQNLQIIGEYQVDGTEGSYDRSEIAAGTESNYDYFVDTQVNAGDSYTHTTETEVANGNIGGNLRFGRRLYGRYIYAQPIDTGGGVLPDDKINYLPQLYTVIAYNSDGTKTAIFGAGAEKNTIEQLTFELVETGCGQLQVTFRELPANTELDYRQRIDIHLFNDSRPWYSGYIITRPVVGTTDDTFKFTGHGFYNLLDKVFIFKTYENMEVSKIVADIAKQIETKVGLTYNSNKITSAAYSITKIEFNGVSAKEALKQLADFAIDYVYGVDEYRQLYFRPRNNEINEQARFWVGQHISKYSPTWNVEKIVNRAYIKGAAVDVEGEQWLATVEDVASQAEYGIQEAVWSLPSAYSTADAGRWGLNQIEEYKEPVKSAKVQDVILEYPKPDGSFFVRKLSTQGQAAITDLDGNRYDYPITKLKYTISGTDGIKLDMELGEQPFAIDKYFANLDRDAKLAELLQQAATKQLKTGG